MRLRFLMRGKCPTTAGIFEGTHGGWLWKNWKKPEMGTSVMDTNCCCLCRGPLICEQLWPYQKQQKHTRRSRFLLKPFAFYSPSGAKGISLTKEKSLSAKFQFYNLSCGEFLKKFQKHSVNRDRKYGHVCRYTCNRCMCIPMYFYVYTYK